MNKELFVSSTPHETKVGLVEDDLLAEIYLERENEYTLAGSIYKGRVTRVLPGMQSAFVDIGLERDAFLYVSDFMELEEHDEDVTDIVPANRAVPDMRLPAPSEAVASEGLAGEQESERNDAFDVHGGQDFLPAEESGDGQSIAPSGESAVAKDSQDRERGGWRGRRRRRGGRRDGRNDGRDGRDRSAEPRPATAAIESAPVATPFVSRPAESRRPTQFGPPAGYQPIILPGESISKYRGLAHPAAPQFARSQPQPEADTAADQNLESSPPIAATFPEDEPIFAATPAEEQQREEAHSERAHAIEAAPLHEERAVSAEASIDWNREFRRRDSATAAAAAVARHEAVQEEHEIVQEEEDEPESESASAISDEEITVATEQVVAFASPGTLEEETIDEEEAAPVL
jgi:hypothetical protein